MHEHAGSWITKGRVFALLCGACVTGVGIASFAPSVYLVLAFFIFGIGAMAYALRSGTRRRAILILGCAALLCAGGMLRFITYAIPDPPLPERFFGTDIEVVGRISEEPIDKEKSQQITLQTSFIELGDKRVEFSETIRVTARRFPKMVYGARVRVVGSIEEPENFADDFDYRAYLAKDRIRYVMVFPDIVQDGESRWGVRSYLFWIKKKFADALYTALPEPHASFAAGLLLGERGSIPKELLEDFRRTGTTHIIALSGYNITIVADAALQALSWFGISFAASFWASSLAIILFAMLTGASASVVRASLMGILVLVARKEGRMYSMRNALLAAASLMVIENPMILRFDAAFQLSFLATVGLVYLSSAIDARLEALKEKYIRRFGGRIPEERAGKKKFFLREIFVSTLAAQILVLPLLIHLFGSVSIISPISNVLVLAAIPYAMFFSFLTGALGLVVGVLARIAAFPAWALLEYEMVIVRFFAGLPMAAVALPKFVGVLLALGYAAMLVMRFYPFRKSVKTDEERRIS